MQKPDTVAGPYPPNPPFEFLSQMLQPANAATWLQINIRTHKHVKTKYHFQPFLPLNTFPSPEIVTTLDGAQLLPQKGKSWLYFVPSVRRSISIPFFLPFLL